MDTLTGFMVPVAVILVVIVGFFLVLRSVFSLYVKVPPNKAAIFYGRKSKTEGGQLIGAKVVSGGGKFRIPLVEAVEWLDLSTMSMDLEVKDIPNTHGVPVSIKGVANVKIKSDDVSLASAAERFLGKKQEEVKAIVLDNLHGHLRAILGKMSIEALIRDREQFNSSVLSEAGEDLGKMGMQVDILKIQDIKDSLGYIEALGKPQTAQVKADAQMKEAERQGEADQKTAEFNQMARTVEAKNAALIAEAEKDRDVKKATYLAGVQAEQARAEQAGPLATAQAKQAVIMQETEVANKEAERKAAQLLAEVVKPAEAAKRKVVVDAEAAKEQKVL
ncbi:MAG: flotillin family protein, partial [Parcubacteria group bacterium]|nr:flotillin family protein [Parcubacteria group bacterium]